MPPKLFADDDDESLQNEDISKIEIDEDYGRRLLHNREREDLQRYEELMKKGVIDDDDDDSEEESESDDDDDDDVGDRKSDIKFLERLIKVKRQDPSIKNKDFKLFESDESDEEEDEDKKKDPKTKSKKKMYLKDVQAKHLLEEGPDFVDEDSDLRKEKKVKTYVEQQEELRQDLVDAMEVGESDGDDELLIETGKKGDDDLEEDEEELKKKAEEYFGEEGEVDENQKFLRDYLVKEMWKDKNEKGIDEEELDELEEDEEAVEMQEVYETKYRHEEKAGEIVMGQSRIFEGSVRKKETARKGQRKNKEERMKMAEMERKEELKQLKNIKKKEMKEKMKKVLSVAGFKDGDEFHLDAKDLDGEFDPEKYDEMMKAAFDDNYYGKEDSGLSSDEDGEKPDFDKEDELLGLPKDWEVTQGGDGFLTTREMALKHKENDDAGDEENEEEEERAEEGKRKRKRKTSLVQRAKEELMEEYYKLDYEDTIGDLKTRFSYAKVEPNSYELETYEILCLDDTELNQYVPLKKIAPYTEKDWEVNKYKVKEQKRKIKELLLEESGKHDEKRSKKKRRSDVVDVKKTKPALAYEEGESSKKNAVDVKTKEPAPADEGEASKLSKKAKRRRRHAEKKLPPSRMAAYGKA